MLRWWDGMLSFGAFVVGIGWSPTHPLYAFALIAGAVYLQACLILRLRDYQREEELSGPDPSRLPEGFAGHPNWPDYDLKDLDRVHRRGF